MFVNQQTGTQVTTSFPLDLLKGHPAPTLVTDGNGNHYLIALTNNSVDNRNSESPQSKTNGRITLQVMLMNAFTYVIVVFMLLNRLTYAAWFISENAVHTCQAPQPIG